jgi:DNA (cytosine-5)-methyltransferase 3A
VEVLATKENIEVLSLEQYLDLKSKGVEFTGQSYLFWEFVRILEEAKKINPNVLFLLENVEMGKRWESVFDKALNTKGVHINSALVSAQNRKRIYWTNINDGSIPLPKDRGLVLKDVMEEVLEDNRFLSEKALAGLQRHLERNKSNGNGFGIDCRTENQKSQTLRLGGAGVYDLVYQKDRIRRLTPVERARLQTIPEWYKWECSATQQCRMLGNGWTVDVIVHILSHMKMNEIE